MTNGYRFGKEETNLNVTFVSELDTPERDLGELTLVRIIILCWILTVFPGSHLQTLEQVEFNIQSVALVSTRIWLSFLVRDALS